jgi:tetratricopeptide (TPR) repeat protein
VRELARRLEQGVTVDGLSAEASAAWRAADAADPGPTLERLRRLRDAYPDDARAHYEWASALDFAGREAEAAPVYEYALELGLPPMYRARALLQLGSTLRNMGQHDEAVDLLARAREEFPDDIALVGFHALALTSAGRAETAVRHLLETLADRLDTLELREYRAALRRYAREL